MLLVKPENVVYETQYDIVDYVTKGLPPSRKNLNRVMATVYQPHSSESLQEKAPDVIAISTDLFPSNNNDEFGLMLNRVYENNVRNRNFAIAGIVGAFALGIFVGGSCHKSKDKDDDR